MLTVFLYTAYIKLQRNFIKHYRKLGEKRNTHKNLTKNKPIFNSRNYIGINKVFEKPFILINIKTRCHKENDIFYYNKKGSKNKSLNKAPIHPTKLSHI